MTATVIIDAIRTPVGKYGGALGQVRPDDLAALTIRALLDRSRIDPALVEEVVLGCTNQAGEDNRNVARMALLLAGLPAVGRRHHRQPALRLRARRRHPRPPRHPGAAKGDVFIAGGVESMSPRAVRAEQGDQRLCP